MTRIENHRAISPISLSAVNIMDSNIQFSTADPDIDKKMNSSLSIEEAQDLWMIIPFNPLQPTDRNHLNPFSRHYEQKNI